MKNLFINALSLPFYALGGYGGFSILEDIGIISQRDIPEQVFLSICLAVGLLLSERVVSARIKNIQ
jgi:hypothetical protein